MVKNRLGFCDILTIPSFRPGAMCSMNISSFQKKELVPEVTLFSYNWAVCDVAIFEVTLGGYLFDNHDPLEQPTSFFACM